MNSYKYPYRMEHITSYKASLSEPEVIGPVAEGLRLNFYVTGGEVLGPKIKGIIRSSGADWFTIRTDGIGILDVRATIETEDGALIYTYYSGMADLGPDGYHQFLKGLPPPPEGIELRIQPHYQTTHPYYLWVNRSFCIGVGKVYLDKSEVGYEIFQFV